MEPTEVLDVVLKERTDGKRNLERLPSLREIGTKTNTSSVIAALQLLSNGERLEVIEAATRLIRSSTVSEKETRRAERARRLRIAAEEARDLYSTGGEHTEWTQLDAEDILDDTCPR